MLGSKDLKEADNPVDKISEIWLALELEGFVASESKVNDGADATEDDDGG